MIATARRPVLNPRTIRLIDENNVALESGKEYDPAILAVDEAASCPSEMTLAQHTEAWWQEQGKTVPAKGTSDYQKMYGEWVEYAFGNPPEDYELEARRHQAGQHF